MAVTIDAKQQAEQALTEILQRYSSGEGAVVRKFFSRPRSNDEYLEVLLRQIGREVQVAHGLDKTAQMGRDLEQGVDRWALYARLEQTADEIKHHALLADLAEWLVGHKLGADQLRKYEVHAFYEEGVDDRYLHNPLLPEAGRMVDVSRELAAAIPRHILSGTGQISEGGGGQAFLEASKLHGDEFQKRFAKVMGDIARDELQHGPEHVHSFVEQHVHSPEDLDLACKSLTAIMRQHLRLRNEIYSHPLTEDEMASYDR
jgi:hypothetical protein